MDTQRLVLGLTFVLITACTTTQKTANPELTLFKNYALVTCLGSAAQTEKSQRDFNLSANGYMERSHISLEGMEAIRNLSDQWLRKDFASKNGSQVNSTKCMDLFYSPELEALFQQYDPCKNPETWLDEEEFSKSCQ